MGLPPKLAEEYSGTGKFVVLEHAAGATPSLQPWGQASVRPQDADRRCTSKVYLVDFQSCPALSNIVPPGCATQGCM
jgi:hypothetical protein